MLLNFAIIAALLAYIGYLHVQGIKKNQRIEEIQEKLSGIEQILSSQGLEGMISKIIAAQKVDKPKVDKVFDESIQQFIHQSQDTEISFLHYTMHHDTARSICDEGFVFQDSFHKTAEEVSKNKEDFAYRHFLQKMFGDFIVIISIDKKLYNSYLEQIKHDYSTFNVEQIISRKVQDTQDEDSDTYLLPREFVKGFVNYKTGEIFSSPFFNPQFKPFPNPGPVIFS